MAALDFPDAPAVGEEFGSEGLIWIWDGTQWIIKGGGAGGGGGSGFTFSQDSAPIAADVGEVGDTWFNTATGDSFVWTDDGDSQQWVQFAPGAGGGGGGGGGGSTTIEVGTKVGVISSWANDQPVPADCLVCDGQAIPAGAEYDQLRALHGTNVPDMRDRFLLGAGSLGVLGALGGASTHTLTIAEMPSHTHRTGISNTTAGTMNAGSSSAQVSFAQNQTPSEATGGGAAHNNMPPYYVIIFIIQARPTLATVAASSSAGGGDGGSGFTFVTDVAPTATEEGDTWFDTSTAATGGTSWVALDEGSGELVWVQFAPGQAATPPLVNRSPWSVGITQGPALALTINHAYVHKIDKDVHCHAHVWINSDGIIGSLMQVLLPTPAVASTAGGSWSYLDPGVSLYTGTFIASGTTAVSMSLTAPNYFGAQMAAANGDEMTLDIWYVEA